MKGLSHCAFLVVEIAQIEKIVLRLSWLANFSSASLTYLVHLKNLKIYVSLLNTDKKRKHIANRPLSNVDKNLDIQLAF